MRIISDPRAKLIEALRRAKRSVKDKRNRPQETSDRSPGTGTNEGGPQVETDYPANAWPEDGDHG